MEPIPWRFSRVGGRAVEPDKERTDLKIKDYRK